MKAFLSDIRMRLRGHSKAVAASVVVAVCLVSLATATYLSSLRSDRFATRADPPLAVEEAPPGKPDRPAILSASDADLYIRIFTLQRQGKFSDADALAGRINDTLLMGHVAAQRLQHTAHPKMPDLKRWLLEYADHPDAGWIHGLVQKRLPRKARKAKKPLPRQSGLAVVPDPPRPYVSKKNLTRKQQRRVRRIKKAVRIWLRRGHIRKTERLLRRGYVIRLLDRFEMDQARSKIAAAWFYRGKKKKAYRLAESALARSGDRLPMTHWIAGLAAWKMGQIDQAARHFETLAESPGRSGWIHAGAALWAARAQRALGNMETAQRWLEEAARYPHTLYGVWALGELERPLPFAQKLYPFTAAMAETLFGNPAGRRALALGQIGEVRRAEQELLAIRAWRKPAMRTAMRGAAYHFGIPSIPLKLMRRERAANPGRSANQPLDPSLYPILPWTPDTKSGIDQALILAFMRQESDFNSFALSPAGALGLMQLMPTTARMLNRGRRFRGARRLDWADPTINIDLGRRYLSYLRKHKRVRNDLIKMIAAYNSGPGNIGYWARKHMDKTDDPLLFIESIPNLETRLFVRRVLANLWIYRHRLGQTTPSLDALAAGSYPRYRPLDGGDRSANVADMGMSIDW